MYFTRGTATLYRTALRDPRPRPRRGFIFIYLSPVRGRGSLYSVSRMCRVSLSVCGSVCSVESRFSGKHTLKQEVAGALRNKTHKTTPRKLIHGYPHRRLHSAHALPL